MFKNRKDAGQRLGIALDKYRMHHVIVLGIPRGGIETAYYVARHLNADLSVVISRKLGYPGNPEAAFGALAEDGSLYLSPFASQAITDDEIERIQNATQNQINIRVQQLRDGKPVPNLKNRIAIIVDDGIATGATMFAAIQFCKTRHPSRIVVAAPAADPEMENVLRRKVDDVVILEKPLNYEAVSQVYEEFNNLSDDEAIQFLEKYQRENLEHQA